MANVRVELRIHGRVQGVFYRGSAQRQARQLGLSGYARNRDDGSVEVVAEGDEARIEELIAWCRMGPRSARVAKVDVSRSPPTGEFSDFDVD
jgi:acylphosphatase